MKNKLLSILLTICMVALLLPVSVIPAYAETTTETRTVTFYLNGGTSGSTTQQDDWTLISGGIRLHYNNNATSTNKILLFPDNNQTTLGSQILQCNGSFEFPNLEGTVKSVTFTNFILAYDGVQMYVGLNKNNNSTLLHLAGNATDYDFSGDSDFSLHSATFEGSQVVSASNPLKIMFSGEPEAYGYFTFVSGTIVITYDVEVEDTTDPGHTFTFAANANSDALIATCTEGSTYHTCGLTNRQVTMPLVANDVPFDHYWHSASLDQTDFNSAGITDIGAILSYKDKSTNETLDNPPSVIGNYTVTATVTVTYKETPHPFTLTKDFSIYNGVITCDYPQFSFSPTPAIAGNDVTITFTPIAGETVTSLTLTGATTNMSIGNGITDNGNGTYTFTMVSESLTLGATVSAPDASNFEQTGTDEYTIKTANGWDWFCFTVSYGLAPDGYSGKTVVLAASVGSSEMAGTSDHPFKGTFDGQSNTLTFNLHAGEGYSAPFHYTNGATIKNFHVEGTITGGDNTSLGGLVGKATGNITIENCRVSTEISTTHSGAAWHGGVIALWYDSNVACTVTGCVYDGLIYNPSEADATTYCSGFIGNLFGSNLTVTFTDCLYAPAAYGTGEYAPGDNCYTFVYPNSSPTYNMTNCYYTTALGKRQGRPAATATDAPANLGDATTDHGLVKGYANGFLYNGNYYTPKYGDAVVEYVFNALWEHADVTINGQGDNLVGVNITEEVGNVTSVTYNRTFTSGVAAAVILPFDYTCNGNEGGSFYSFAGVSGTTPVMEDGNHVTSLTANTPYLFVPTATAMTFPNISKMTDGVVTLKPTAGDHTVTSGDWTLTGIYAPKTWTGIEPDYENAFILNSIGKLNHVSIDEMVKPTDGYFVGSVITYTVTFDANGGTGTIAAETVTGGATYTLPACTFTAPEGKTFFAWSVKIGDAEAVNKQPGDTIEVTADTTVTATWEWRLQDGYYLIGPDWTYGAIDAGDRFEVNPGNENEYMLRTTLSEGDEIKVVRVENNAIAGWFPDGLDNQYHVDAAHAGDVVIYFSTEYNDAWSEFGGYFYIEAVTEPSFKTHSLVLSGRIGVNFFMDLPTIEGVDYAESYMTFEISGKGTVPADPVPFDPTHTNAKSTYYSFTCYVNSIQMADTITATFHYGDGLTVSETYSIRQYIASFDAYLAAHPGAYDDVTVNLVHALADYGHFVQPFLSAARGWTIGSGDDQYAEMDTVYTTEYNINAVKTAVADYGIQRTMSADIAGISYSLLMDSDTAIYLYFKPIADYDGAFTVDGYTATKQKDGRYLVVIPNIGAHKLGDPYTVVVTTTNGESTVTVSALSYVKGILNAEAYQDNTAAQYAAASIYHYYAAAAAYKRIHP